MSISPDHREKSLRVLSLENIDKVLAELLVAFFNGGFQNFVKRFAGFLFNLFNRF